MPGGRARGDLRSGALIPFRPGDALLDGELVEALRDETIREATREMSRLPKRERRLVLGIVRQFADQQAKLGSRKRQDSFSVVD
jgi:hypothetical protein